jgi:hypothetical protein
VVLAGLADPWRGKRYFITDKPMRQTLPPDLRARLEARLVVDEGKARQHSTRSSRRFAGFVIANSRGGMAISRSIWAASPTAIRDIAKSKDLEKPTPQGPEPARATDLVDAMVKSLGDAPQPLQELCLDAGLQARPRTARATDQGDGRALGAGRGARGGLGRPRLLALPGLDALHRPRAARWPDRRGQGDRGGA